MLSPRQIKAKRILLGLKVKDLAVEASRAMNRPIGESTVAQILGRRMQGSKPEIHDLQKFIAKRLKISVKDLKPPFEVTP
jgi:chromosomal replication initiation ATPase DnaA